MVVDLKYRSKGVRRKLLDEAVAWAKENEASGIIINSGNRQERYFAHMFYKKMGYDEKSIRFAKSLV